MREKFLKRKKKTYAIYGMGSTRLSIALANYYASYLKKSVAIAEVGNGNLSDISGDNSSKEHISMVDKAFVGFRIMKVDYYPFINTDLSMKLKGEDYDVIIWDFEDLSHDYMMLYGTCDTRIYLSNIASYNRRLFCQNKNLFESDMIKVELYCYFLNKKDLRWYDKTVGRSDTFSSIREMGLIKDPNRLSKDDLEFLKKVAVE